jgi:extracellular matrix protein 14
MKLTATRLAGPALSSILFAGLIAPTPASAVATTGDGIYRHRQLHPTASGRFPLLTKLRDGAIELIFGAHPDKPTSTSSKSTSQPLQFTDELVLRFNVTSAAEETALAEAAARMFLDIWAFTSEYVDIRLHAKEVAPLLSLLPPSLQSAQAPLISDLAAAVHDAQPSESWNRHVDPDQDRYGASLLDAMTQSRGDNLFFQDYQPPSVVVRWMRLLEAMFPSYVCYFPIGLSYEGREISALRVGVPSPATPQAPRKTIVVTGGLHAREWISTTTVNYLAWSVITSFGKDPMITKLLDEFDIVFIPTLNPDGVEYTWNVDRLWRKSRQRTGLQFCRGLDLDHTFGFRWDGSAAQTDPCSESYGGEVPFEAVEAQQFAAWSRNETENNNVKFVGLIDLHSYSQQILFPFSYSCEADPPNIENLEELAAGIAKAIRLSNGESYSVSSACEGAVAQGSNEDVVGPRVESGGGSVIDWYYHEMGAHYSYQIKLRDTGSYGFLLPREYIIPTGQEIFNAIKYFGDYLLGNNGIERFNSPAGMTASGPDDEIDVDAALNGNQELRKRTFRG